MEECDIGGLFEDPRAWSSNKLSLLRKGGLRMRRRTIAAFVLGPLLSAGLGLLTLPLTAWLFEPADVGRLNILQALIAVAMNFVFMGLDNAFEREFHEESARGGLYAATMFPPRIVLLVICLPIAFFPDWFARLAFGLDVPALAYMTVLVLFGSLLVRQWLLLARMNERAVAFSASQLLAKLAMLIGLIVVATQATKPSFNVLAGVLLLSIILPAVHLRLATCGLRERFEMRQISLGRLWKLLRYGLPSMVAAFAYVALSAVAPFSLRAFSGFHELGVYSVAAGAAAAVGVVQFAVNTVWAPIIFRANASGRAQVVYPTALRIISLLFATVVSGAALVSWMLPILLPKDYWEVQYLFVGAVFVPLLWMMRDAGGVGNNISRRMGLAALSSVFALTICVVLSILFVPAHGARGAIVAGLLSMWLLFVLNAELAARSWLGVPRKAVHLTVGFAVALGTLTVVFGEMFAGVHWLAWSIYLTCVLIEFRGEIRQILKRR